MNRETRQVLENQMAILRHLRQDVYCGDKSGVIRRMTETESLLMHENSGWSATGNFYLPSMKNTIAAYAVCGKCRRSCFQVSDCDVERIEYNYCPWCGADMKGGADDV